MVESTVDGVEPAYLSKIERGDVAPPSEAAAVWFRPCTRPKPYRRKMMALEWKWER